MPKKLFENQQSKHWNSIRKRRSPIHPVVKNFVLPKIKFIEGVTKINPGSKTLDVGCGNGFFTYYWARKYDTIGLDSSERMLALNPHKKLVKGNVEDLPFKDGSFDLVFCSNLLHHLANPLGALVEMARVSKKFICISEPNRNSPAIALLGIISREERKSLKFTPTYLFSLFQKAGIKIIEARNMGLITPNKTPKWLIRPLSSIEQITCLKPLMAYTVIVAKKR